MNTKTIRFLKSLSTGLVILAMIFAFLIAGVRIFGVQVYGVLTGSMEPSYPTGSLIYVKRVDASDLRVNDVITFSISPNVIATHRIVEIVPDESNPTIVRYRTKGDANKDVDASLVSANNIIGKAMFAIPKLGYLASFIQQPPGIYVAILVCGLMIAFVFYTDSLDSKQKSTFRRSPRRGYQSQKHPQSAQQRKYSQQRERPQQRDYQQQRSYSQQEAYSQQRSYPQQGYSQQVNYPQQGAYSQQRSYPQQGYSQQRSYPEQGAYSQQRSYPQQGYSQQRNYPQQDAYSQQGAYSQQRSYRQQGAYPQQQGYPYHREYEQEREYSPQRETTQQREYTQQRSNRADRR